MAATYYLDSAGDNSDGSTWAKAFTTLAGAMNAIVANNGDVVKFRGTLSGAACQATWANGGTYTGRSSLIGCNAAGVEDGTRAVLDLNGAGSILTISTKQAITIRNVTFRRAGANGIVSTGNCSGMIIDNCLFELNLGGFAANGIIWGASVCRKTTFSSNSYSGANGPSQITYQYCHVNNNGGAAATYGLYGDYIGVYGCVFVAQTSANAVYALGVGYGFAGIGQVQHCVFYGNKFGIYCSRGGSYYLLAFNKFLSNTTGINVLTNSQVFLSNNGWNGNGAKYALAGTGCVEVIGGEIDMAADGCVNAAAGNFNNSATSEGIFVATSIDGTNYSYEHIGLPYGPAPVIPTNAQVINTLASWGFNAEYGPGTVAAEAHAANQVLKSAGGNWDDDNLGVGSETNVRTGKAYGLTQVGTLIAAATSSLKRVSRFVTAINIHRAWHQ